MTLRRKTLTLTMGTLAVLILLLYVFARFTLLDSFVHLEEQSVRENTERIVNTLADDMAALERTSADWANWDDTYAFVQGEYPEYAEVNLLDNTYYNLDLNVMVFLAADGDVVYGRSFDLTEGVGSPLPSGIESYLAESNPLRADNGNEAVTGLILIDGIPALVAARPILTSTAEGPSAGTLLFARYLTAEKIAALSDSIGVAMSYANPTGTLPDDFRAAFDSLVAGSGVAISAPNDTTVYGYTLLTDVVGSPALLLRAELPRAIYWQGWGTVTYFVVAVVLVGVVFGVLIVVMLNRMVLARLAQLSDGVSRISSSGDPTAQVAFSGSDELARLASTINGMVKSLAESQIAVRESEKQLQTVVNNAPVTIWALDTQGQVTLLRGKGLETLGFRRGLNAEMQQSVISRSVQPMIEHSRNALIKGQESSTVLRAGSRVFDTRYSPLRDDDGKIVGVIGTATDITERREAEEALQAATARVEKQSHEIERVQEFFRSTLEQMTSTIKLGATRGELLNYLDTVQSQFDRLGDSTPQPLPPAR